LFRKKLSFFQTQKFLKLFPFRFLFWPKEIVKKINFFTILLPYPTFDRI